MLIEVWHYLQTPSTSVSYMSVRVCKWPCKYTETQIHIIHSANSRTLFFLNVLSGTNDWSQSLKINIYFSADSGDTFYRFSRAIVPGGWFIISWMSVIYHRLRIQSTSLHHWNLDFQVCATSPISARKRRQMLWLTFRMWFLSFEVSVTLFWVLKFLLHAGVIKRERLLCFVLFWWKWFLGVMCRFSNFFLHSWAEKMGQIENCKMLRF